MRAFKMYTVCEAHLTVMHAHFSELILNKFII